MLRISAAVGLALVLSGCSEATSDPAANASGETAATAPPVPVTTPANAVEAEGQNAGAFQEQLARLVRTANAHESRQYFDMALEARREIRGLVDERYGPNSWQSKSALASEKYTELLLNATGEQQLQLRELVEAQRRAVELRELGHSAESLAAFERAAELARETLGDQHQVYANLLVRQGEMHTRLAQYPAALRQFPQAAEICEKTFGKQHPERASVLHDWGVVCRLSGDADQGERLLREALEIRHATLGPTHPDCAATVYQLGAVHHSRKEFDKAAPLLAQALAALERVVGRKHPAAIRVIHLVGMNHLGQRNYALAEPLLREALAGWRLASGENSPDYAEGLHSLGVFHGNQGQYAQAEPLVRQALDIQERTLAAGDRLLAETRGTYAELLKKANRVAEAEALEAKRRQ